MPVQRLQHKPRVTTTQLIFGTTLVGACLLCYARSLLHGAALYSSVQHSAHSAASLPVPAVQATLLDAGASADASTAPDVLPCLITRWSGIWRVHADHTRSFVAHPPPGCAARATPVNNLEVYPKVAGDASYTLDVAASASACTRPCEAAAAPLVGSEPTAAALDAAAASAAAAAIRAAASGAARRGWAPVRASERELEAARREARELDLLPLGGQPGDAFLLAVRRGTGTVEAVSPVSLPHFSYTLPIRDASARLHWSGSGPQVRDHGLHSISARFT